MFNLQTYLKEVQSKIPSRSGSTVEQDVYNEVKKRVEKKEPTLLADIAKALNKRMQHIHQVVKHSKRLKKVKLGKRTLIVPADTE